MELMAEWKKWGLGLWELHIYTCINHMVLGTDITKHILTFYTQVGFSLKLAMCYRAILGGIREPTSSHDFE